MTYETRTKKKVVLHGSVSEIDEGGTSFKFQPIYGEKLRAFASKGILEELTNLLKEGGDHARLLVKGIGVYRYDELEYLMQVDTVSLIPLLDVPAQLDEFRDMQDGWADGIQYASDWGNGYGKAPSHEGLDWLADKFTSEYPGDLPLPRAYPTPEGDVQMEWLLGRIDISLEIDLGDHTSYWHWVDLNGFDRDGEKELNLDDGDSWAWLTSTIRRLVASSG